MEDKLKTFCFDLDGTLCSTKNGDYLSTIPFLDRIKRVNALHDKGHRILIYTARGMATGFDYRILTERQLQKWGLEYDKLIMDKPEADVYVDDRALNIKDW